MCTAAWADRSELRPAAPAHRTLRACTGQPPTHTLDAWAAGRIGAGGGGQVEPDLAGRAAPIMAVEDARKGTDDGRTDRPAGDQSRGWRAIKRAQ